MKKILAILLSVLMITSVMALPAFAEDVATGDTTTETTTGAALNDLAAYGQGIYTVAESTPKVDGVIAEGEYTTSMNYYQVSNEQWGNIGGYTLYVAQDYSNIYLSAKFDEAGRSAQVMGNGGNMNMGSRFRVFINFPSEFTAKDANNYLVLNFNYKGNVTGIRAFGDADFVAKIEATDLKSYIDKTPAAMGSGSAGSLNNTSSFNGVGLVTAFAFSTAKGARNYDSVATYEIALSKSKLMSVFGWDGKTDMTYMACLATGYVEGTTNWRNYATQMADSGNYYNAEAAAALEAFSAAKGDNTEVAPNVCQAGNGVTLGNHADVIPDIIKFAPHTHAPAENWKTDADNHWKECACGEKSDNGAHEFGEGVVTTEPTEEAEGVKTFTCGTCGYEKTEAIEKLPHTHVPGEEWKNDADNHWKDCACGAEVDKGAHEFDEGVVTTEPTVDAEGVKTFTCGTCGFEKTEAIDKLDPPVDGGDDTVDPPVDGGDDTVEPPVDGGDDIVEPPVENKTELEAMVDTVVATVVDLYNKVVGVASEKLGCNGSVSLAALAVIPALAVAFVAKKKED